MRLKMLRGTCANGRTCPTIYETDRDTIIIQGYRVLDAEALADLQLPEGEAAVEIPRSLLPEVGS
jgi:hypothetical protein